MMTLHKTMESTCVTVALQKWCSKLRYSDFKVLLDDESGKKSNLVEPTKCDGRDFQKCPDFCNKI